MRSAILIAAVLALALPAVAGADVEIAQEQGETLIAAYGGWVLWSSYDPVGGVSACDAMPGSCERWRLVGRAPGSQSITTFAVAPRPIPFDVDLGPDRRGRPAAVYSRCRHEALGFAGGWRYARHRAGRGCRIVKLDLQSGREATLYRRKGKSLIYPALWRNRLAYVTRGKRPADLHLEQRITDKKRTATIALGRGPTSKTETPRAGPLRLDLYGRNLVFAWETETEPEGCPAPRREGTPDVTRIFVQQGTNRRKLLDYGCADSRGAGAVVRAESVTISDGFITWMHAMNPSHASGASSGGYLRRRSVRTGKTHNAPVDDNYPTLAADGTTLYAQASLHKIISLMPPPFGGS